MQIRFNKANINIVNFLRQAGYSYRGVERGEASFIKRVGIEEYPHFHIYAKEEGDQIILNLHLDQKRASYQGSAGHSGEYDSKLVEKEAERIKNIISNSPNSPNF